jgi:predicted nucleotidyltransferase
MASTDKTKPTEIEFYGGYQVYSESGVDLTLLHAQLQRTVEERWEKNRGAKAFQDELRRAGEVAQDPTRTSSWSFPMFDAEAMVRQLAEQRIEFVIIGGLAMIAHGSAYVTKDLDVCYHRSPASIAALAAAVAPIHPYLRGAPPGLPFRFDAPTIQAGLNFTLITDYGDIDFLGEVSGIGGYDRVLALAVPMKMYGLEVQVLSIDGLIAAKKAAGRTKDKLHLLELEELKKLRDAAPDKEQP